MGYIIPPAGSSSTALPIWISLETPWSKISRRYPIPIPGPQQLAPFEVKEQRLFSELPPDVWEPLKLNLATDWGISYWLHGSTQRSWPKMMAGNKICWWIVSFASSFALLSPKIPQGERDSTTTSVGWQPPPWSGNPQVMSLTTFWHWKGKLAKAAQLYTQSRSAIPLPIWPQPWPSPTYHSWAICWFARTFQGQSIALINGLPKLIPDIFFLLFHQYCSPSGLLVPIFCFSRPAGQPNLKLGSFLYHFCPQTFWYGIHDNHQWPCNHSS